MYDFNGIRIYFKEEFLRTTMSRGEVISYVDLEECGRRGLKIIPRDMTWEIDGDYQYHDLFHPWDSLPSSFTGIAFKLYQASGFRTQPCIELKASPAKVAQGHNVYGSDCLELGIRNMFQTLKHCLPYFSEMLNFDEAEVFRLDATYSIQLPDRDCLASALDTLSKVSNRYLRPSRQGDFESTIYFNKARNNPNTGRTTSLCIYSKLDEVQYQLEDLQKKASKEKTARYDRVIAELSSPELQDFATNRLRFESRCMSRFFDKHRIPRRVNDLLKYVKGFEQENGEGAFCRWLWKTSMCDLLDAIEGQQITVIHDSKVKKLLHAKFDTIGKNGKLRTAKAVRLFGVYSRLVHEGYDKVKRNMGRSSFYNAICDLREIGFAKAQLQNLDKRERTPLVNMLKFDFDAQCPDSYVEPEMPCNAVDFESFTAMLNGIKPLSEELVHPDQRVTEELENMGVNPMLLSGLKRGRQVRLSSDEALSLAFWPDGSYNLVKHHPKNPPELIKESNL
ncbi:phage/plasmid replication protein, II/X family [Photobacterium sanguinicancri]|uniref:phage/plasmid replication protein, II/X family n=1 Tax=Photobacterium sanguinicancri TaxID=875932 RepID=UPI0026E1BF04|nr:phage/plasmid replication protein, II/X family [Photobacterium sanguinicancri]MDO6499249.1 phage/plasmid replication protein, II/X family [Photobacterium sanguinicancri]MDO6499257.1 phage/plasmid replication protein, II/X family [Photobacterium sanguinicancri]